MLLVQLDFCLPKIKKGHIYREYKEYPLVSFSFFLIRITYLKAKADQLFTQTLRGVLEDPDYMIDNAHKVRKATKDAKRKATAHVKANHQEALDDYRERYLAESTKRTKAETELFHLKATIKILTSKVEATAEL